jgi:hypothetical protein
LKVDDELELATLWGYVRAKGRRRMRPYNGPRPWDDDFLDKREALNANAD